MAILVTGGAGYIGSHTVLQLLQRGDDVVVVDNLCNSSAQSLQRVEKLAQRGVTFYQQDVRNADALRQIFAQHPIDAVIHFAGLKAVGESTQKPLEYYQNNISATLTLCEVMREFNVFSLVFSSSATVYGDPITVPIKEDFATSATNPYGQSKLMVELILRDLAASDKRWQVALLRYFNPVGAHESGLIGEDPNGIPNNLTPYITQVLVGKLPMLRVFGNDYPTKDGTGVRDYIHVVDLADGHLAAIDKLKTNPGLVTYNLGTGQGYSVLDMIAAFEQASGNRVAYEFAPRRPGDIATCYADPSYAQQELGWQAKRGLVEMTADAWRWQVNNPKGYQQD